MVIMLDCIQWQRDESRVWAGNVLLGVSPRLIRPHFCIQFTTSSAVQKHRCWADHKWFSEMQTALAQPSHPAGQQQTLARHFTVGQWDRPGKQSKFPLCFSRDLCFTTALFRLLLLFFHW